MRLYSIQTLDVIVTLKKESIYFPDFDKCVWLNDPEDNEITKKDWRLAFEWMTDQYNKRKGHDFSSAPVWWYTQLKELKKNLCYVKPYEVIIQADVPDRLVMLHDADAWSDGPFSGWALGWKGHGMYTKNDWTGTNYAELFDRLYDLYKNNPESTIETWNEVFNITKTGNQRIHATTPFIDLSWIEGNSKLEHNSTLEM